MTTGSDKRINSRIFPRDFRAFVTTVLFNGFDFRGSLGNISEDGLCVIVPIISGPNEVAIGTEISGHIDHQAMNIHLDYAGGVAWTEVRPGSSIGLTTPRALFIGVRFHASMQLPISLIALCEAIGVDD